MIKNFLVLPVFAVSFIAGSNPSDEKRLVPYDFGEAFNTNVSPFTKDTFPYIINTIIGHELILGFVSERCIKVSIKNFPNANPVFIHSPYTRYTDNALKSNVYQISLKEKSKKLKEQYEIKVALVDFTDKQK